LDISRPPPSLHLNGLNDDDVFVLRSPLARQFHLLPLFFVAAKNAARSWTLLASLSSPTHFAGARYNKSSPSAAAATMASPTTHKLSPPRQFASPLNEAFHLHSEGRERKTWEREFWQLVSVGFALNFSRVLPALQLKLFIASAWREALPSIYPAVMIPRFVRSARCAHPPTFSPAATAAMATSAVAVESVASAAATVAEIHFFFCHFPWFPFLVSYPEAERDMTDLNLSPFYTHDVIFVSLAAQMRELHLYDAVNIHMGLFGNVKVSNFPFFFLLFLSSSSFIFILGFES
jgi:hypothetical protein